MCNKPLAIDLFCGLGGWTEGFLAEGWRVVGFDIERHDYGTGVYPAQLVIQDVLTLHGSQFKDAACIVASPPCQAYSYRAMPWKRAKALPPPSNELFDACFRIQKEACEATCSCECHRCKVGGHCVRCDCFYNTGRYSRYIPMVCENVRGAQKWVGRAAWQFGSFFLWGDVPALMPTRAQMEGKKLAGNNAPRLWSERRIQRLAEAKCHDTDSFYMASGGSLARKAASAAIAKIPFPLARHIAMVFHP